MTPKKDNSNDRDKKTDWVFKGSRPWGGLGRTPYISTFYPLPYRLPMGPSLRSLEFRGPLP